MSRLLHLVFAIAKLATVAVAEVYILHLSGLTRSWSTTSLGQFFWVGAAYPVAVIVVLCTAGARGYFRELRIRRVAEGE